MNPTVLSLTMLLAALAFLGGCNKQDGTVPPGPLPPAGETEIMLGSSVMEGTSAQTRQPYEEEISASNPLRVMVLANWNLNMTPSTRRTRGTMTFNDNSSAVVYDKPVDEGESTFREDPEEVLYFAGFYPLNNAIGSLWDVDNELGLAEFDFTGCEDVMYAPSRSATANEVKGGVYPMLRFEHRLTKLQFLFSGDQAATDLGIQVTGLKLIKVAGSPGGGNVPHTIRINQSTINSELINWDNGWIDAWDITMDDTESKAFTDAPYPITNTPVAKAYMLAPYVTTISGPDPVNFEYRFEIAYTVTPFDSPSEPRIVTVDIDLMNMAGNSPYIGKTTGKAWEITFNFKGNQIVAIASITPWEDGGTVIQDI